MCGRKGLDSTKLATKPKNVLACSRVRDFNTLTDQKFQLK